MGTGDSPSVSNGIVISELRFKGSGGASDEFVELYNSTDTAIVVGGYSLRGSNSSGLV